MPNMIRLDEYKTRLYEIPDHIVRQATWCAQHGLVLTLRPNAVQV